MSPEERLRQVVEEFGQFRLCGPGDDPDLQTNVIVGFNHLLAQVRRLTQKLAPAPLASEIAGISVDLQDIFSVYEAKAQLDALLPEVMEYLDAPSNEPVSSSDLTLAGVRKLMHAKGRDDLVSLLSRMDLEFDESSNYGSYWNSFATTAVFSGPIEDCELLRALEDEDKELLQTLLRELNPPCEGGMDISSLDFVVDPFRPTLIELHEFGLETGWGRVDRSVRGIREKLQTAGCEEQYQGIGLDCRETLISVAQAVFNPAIHTIADGVEASPTDAKRMLDAYLDYELAGPGNKEARKHAKAAFDLANKLQHDRVATHIEALLCAEATTSVVNILAIVSGKRTAAQPSC